MPEAFPVSGNIDPVSFPHLLVDLHRHGATGSLKVSGSTHPKALYFRNGRILFGSSNDPRDQLGAILIENGRLTREQLDQVTAKVGPGNPLAKVLADSGFVSPRELGEAARVKVERILADLLSWESGTFEFEDGVLPKGAVDLKLSTEKLLLAAVQRIPDRGFALRHVDLATVLEPTPEGEAALSEIRAEVWPLLERLDGQRTLKDAIALTRLDEFEAAKTACGLLFLDVVKAKPEGADEVDLAQEAQSGFGAENEPPLFTVPLTTTAPQEPVYVFPPEAPDASAADVPETETETQRQRLEREASFIPEAPPTAAPTSDRSLRASPPSRPPEPDAEESATIAVTAPVLPPDAPTFVLPPPSVAPLRPVVPPQPQAPPPPAEFRAPVPGAKPTPPEPPAPAAAPAIEPEPTVRFPAARPLIDAEPAFSPPPFSPPPPAPSAPASAPSPPREDEPAAKEPEPSMTAPRSRPSQADLAALDALLHPSASGRMVRPAPPPPTPRPDKWEPQFRPPQPARPAPARLRSRSSRLPMILIFTAVAAVALTSVAAWYYFVGRGAAGTANPAVAAQHRPVPVATPTPAATATPLAASPSSPTATSEPAPAVTTPAATSAAVARPTPTTAPPPAGRPPATARPEPPAAVARDGAPGPVASRAEASSLMRSGSLPEAARAFSAALAAGPRSRVSIQLLTACAAQTVQKAVETAGGADLFILPVQLQGRACYRLCWGVYTDRQAAEAALASVPAYYRQGGARPRLSPLGEILP